MKEPLPPLLERTAAILADSAQLLLQIEDSIAPLLARPPHGSASGGTGAETVANFRSSVVSLQKIDLLSQTLEDLSFWLDDLAQSVRDTDAADFAAEQAMTRLRLADLRQRLLGEVKAAPRPQDNAPMLF